MNTGMGTNHLKPGWKMVKFCEIAENIADRVDPSDTKTGIYVGLEHLDPGTIRLRRWGHPSEVTGQKLLFKRGDVILGRRRVYQRKLAVAEFDGICSAHAMVARAKPSVILPEFLPFFLQSDMFMERAIQISVGGLSPTINWKALRVQEFPVPPLEEQKRIAEILWAADEISVSLRAVTAPKRQLLSVLICGGTNTNNRISTKVGSIPGHWRILDVGQVSNLCQYGLSIPLYESGTYPILRMMNIEDGEVVDNDLKYVDLKPQEFDMYRLSRGDILFNRTNSADLVGKVGIFRLTGGYVFASYLLRLRTIASIVLPEFLNFYLNSSIGQRHIQRFVTRGVSQSNVNANNLKSIPVPLPPIGEQREIVRIITALNSVADTAGLHYQMTEGLKKSLVQEFVGGHGNLAL